MASSTPKGPPCGEPTAGGGSCRRPLGEDGTCGVDHARERMATMRIVDLPSRVRTMIEGYASTDPITGEQVPEETRRRRGRRGLPGRRLTRRVTRRAARRSSSGATKLAMESGKTVANPSKLDENTGGRVDDWA